MRKQFLGHFKETDETVKELWQTSTFVFDANVLLNLYRYSDDTRNDFLNLLQNLRSRSWLPEQAAHEFLKNRASVIKDQISSYSKTLNDIDKLRKSFSGSRAHPFISKSTKSKFDTAVDKIKNELTENKDKQEELIHKDYIKDKVADLFDGRVGERYTNDELVEIFSQGKVRYDEKVPPGYRDGRKIPDPKTESDKRSNFGDWIIWKQVMDYAASAATPIIFVTDDRKDDWWVEESGKTLGPRPELTNEFVETTSQKLLIYKPDSFLSLSKVQLATKISTKSIEEVEAEHSMRDEQRQKNRLAWNARQRHELERRDLEAKLFPTRRGNKVRNRHSKDTHQDELMRMERKLFMESSDIETSTVPDDLLSELDAVMSHRNALQHHVEDLSSSLHLSETGDSEDRYMMHDLRLQRHSIQEELNSVDEHVSDLKKKISYLSGEGKLF